jgi:hypothetical protein
MLPSLTNRMWQGLKEEVGNGAGFILGCCVSQRTHHVEKNKYEKWLCRRVQLKANLSSKQGWNYTPYLNQHRVTYKLESSYYPTSHKPTFLQFVLEVFFLTVEGEAETLSPHWVFGFLEDQMPTESKMYHGDCNLQSINKTIGSRKSL